MATPSKKEDEKEAALTLTDEFVSGNAGLKDNIFYDKIMDGLTIEVFLKAALPMHTEFGHFTMSAIIRRGNFPRERYNRGCKVKWLEYVYDILTKPSYDYFTREGKNWSYTEKGIKEVTFLSATAPGSPSAMPIAGGEDGANAEAQGQMITTPASSSETQSSFIGSASSTPQAPVRQRKKKAKNSMTEELRVFGYIEKYLKMKGIILPQAAHESSIVISQQAHGSALLGEVLSTVMPNPSSDIAAHQQATYYQQHHTMTTSNDTLLTSAPILRTNSTIEIDSPKYMCVEALGLLEGSEHPSWRIQQAQQGVSFVVTTSDLKERSDRDNILSAIKEYEGGVKRKFPAEDYNNKIPKRD